MEAKQRRLTRKYIFNYVQFPKKLAVYQSFYIRDEARPTDLVEFLEDVSNTQVALVQSLRCAIPR